jgi:hypothetical protein
VEPADGDEDLLTTLAAELRYARGERRAATQDAARRAWSKRVEELVKVIERIAPPPPPPPDLLQRELRRLDGETIALIEQFMADPIRPEDVAA